MKRILFLMVFFGMTIAGSAKVPFQQRPITTQNNRVIPPNERVQVTSKKQTRFDASQMLPDGELKSYKRSGQYTYVKNGYLYRGFQTDKVDIIYTDGNVVYIKNILCGAKNYFGDDFWVQGSINDSRTEITVPLGQIVYSTEFNQANVFLGYGSTIDTGENVTCSIDKNITQLRYVIDDETISCIGTSGLNATNSYAASGLVAYWSDDGSWTGIIECNTVLTEGSPMNAPEVITEAPDNCDVVTYAYRGQCIHTNWTAGWSNTPAAGKIDVAFDVDNTVYLHNPMWRFKNCDSWVKGTFDRETGIISIPTGQYLAWSDKLGYGVQLKWGSTHVVESGIDENGQPQYELCYSVDELVKQIRYKIDGDGLYLLGSDGNVNANYPYNFEANSVMAVFSDNQKVDAIEYGINARLLSELEEGTIPASPYATGFYNSYGYGYSYFYFQLPETDIYGYYLDPDYLSYSIYVDEDEIVSFDPDLYYELDDWMTEIPSYYWGNGEHFFYNQVCLEGIWWDYYRIGIQAHYTVNGEKNSSDISYCYIGGGGWVDTSELPADNTISSVRYFNVMGQEIATPAGLTIKVITYTDGSTTAIKLIQ